MNISFENKVALVPGAASGLGPGAIDASNNPLASP
jgi:hypothetical protein